MKPLVKIAATGAALAALVLPTGAVAAGGNPTLTQAPDSSFPGKVYVLQLPEKKALKTGQVTVTENGGPVLGTTVAAPGNSSGAILLIDASESMKGKPIADAMAAARAFMVERGSALPVAVIAFNPDVTVLTDFTNDPAKLNEAVAKAPELAYGTHIYDALQKAAQMAKDQGLKRSTVVLLSDGQELGSKTTYGQALAALQQSGVRVISVGLNSRFYNSGTLKKVAVGTGGSYTEAANSAQLEPIFSAIGKELANQYIVSYQSLLGPKVKANVAAKVVGYPTAATATYVTPTINLTPTGSFHRDWIDKVILSPWLMVFVVVAVLGLAAFALLSVVEVRSRSLKRRMAAYVSVPSEDESRARRAEVTAALAEGAQRRVGGSSWWKSFESDVELGGFSASPINILGWTIVAGIVSSLVFALALHNLFGLLVGLLAPVIMRFYVRARVTSMRGKFGEQLPDNLEVLAGALRAGHSLVGAMNVMVDGAAEPSQTEFRRVLQDDQLGVPMDEALMVMAGRMENLDVEQVAIVTRLSREAGGNTAEVLDRVVENIRGKMEIRRLIKVLTAQGRLARWVLTGLPIALVIMLLFVNPNWLDPLTGTNIGRLFLVLWVVMLAVGSYVIKRMVEIDI